MKKSFLVVYEKGRKHYSGFAPDVSGCAGLGFTLEEVRADLKAALQIYMDTCAELGYSIPEPIIESVTLPIEGETDPRITYVVEHLEVRMPRAKSKVSKPVRTRIASTRRRALQTA